MEYLTNEKKEELEKELNQLKTVRRKEIAEALEYSKSLGDLSENAEYHQAREDQANCEDRISYLEEILKNVVIMDKSTGGNIFVGTTVKLTKKGESDERIFTIVGSEEADSANGKISNESPLGEALLNKKKGDEVTVETPKGKTTWKVISVE